MHDRVDAKLNALTTELATSAPLPPPMPVLEPRRRTHVVGITTAVGAFLGILTIAVVALLAWTSLSRSAVDVSAAAVFEATGATPVAVVTDDGESLRGFLWQGGSRGTLIVSAYGEEIEDLLGLATSANADGATVMLIDPRGQGGSTGTARADRLIPDVESAVRDLATRGVDRVMVVGVRHAATAAIALAADPPPGIAGVVAFFPFEQYQGIDAIGVVGDAVVPLTIVGASAPSHLGPWAWELTANAPEGTTGILLPSLPNDEQFLTHYLARMIEILRTASR